MINYRVEYMNKIPLIWFKCQGLLVTRYAPPRPPSVHNCYVTSDHSNMKSSKYKQPLRLDALRDLCILLNVFSNISTSIKYAPAFYMSFGYSGLSILATQGIGSYLLIQEVNYEVFHSHLRVVYALVTL